MIEIVPYQPTWPAEFADLGRRLRAELGPLALRIDHIGSTSVPGLAAKDIIDIQVTVAGFIPDVEAAVCRAGFERRPQITHDHVPAGASIQPEEWQKWFFKSLKPARQVNLHVRQQGRANQRYPLFFRDYLRAHPAAAESYARVKMALAKYHADDVDAYYDVKDPVCDLIMAAAEAWASATGWRMGPTDA